MASLHPACAHIEVSKKGHLRPTGVSNDAAQNGYPSTYTKAGNRALRGAVARLYLFAETPRTVPAFREEALRVWEELETAHFEAGITDTEPRAYFLDHLDRISRLNGWEPVIEAL